MWITIDEVRLWVDYTYYKSTGNYEIPSSEDIIINHIGAEPGEDLTKILDSHIKTEDIYDDIKCQIIIYEQSRRNKED